MLTRTSTMLACFASMLSLVLLGSPARAQDLAAIPNPSSVFDSPSEPIVDSAGNIYLSSSTSDGVYQVAADGTVSVVIDRTSGLPLHAFDAPSAMALDSQDNLYVACLNSDNVFRRAPDGSVSVVLDATGDGLGNPLADPFTLVVDGSDDVWIAGQASNNVFRVTPLGQIIVEMDASGLGPAAPLSAAGVHFSGGELFISGAGRVFQRGLGGVFEEILTPAGDGQASFSLAREIVVNTAGTVFVSDQQQVFSIDVMGTVTLIFATFGFTSQRIAADSLGSLWIVTLDLFAMSTKLEQYTLGGSLLTQASSLAGSYRSLATDNAGNVYWMHSMNTGSDWLWRRAADGTITKLVGQLGDGMGHIVLVTHDPLILADGSVVLSGVASDTVLKVGTGGTVDLLVDPSSLSVPVAFNPSGIAVDYLNRVFTSSTLTNRVTRSDSESMNVQVMSQVGDGMGNLLLGPTKMATGSDGSVYVSSMNNNNVLRAEPSGLVTQIIDGLGDGAGNLLARPHGIAVDAEDNVYVAGFSSDNVFKITAGGVISQIADVTGDGMGNPLQVPVDLALDGAGNLYVACESHNVFKITPGGVISEIVDSHGAGPGAELLLPRGVAASWAGDVYVTGAASNNVLHITPGGTVSQILEVSGDGLGNTLSEPSGVAVDAFGAVYVAGFLSNNVFRVDSNGTVTELADQASVFPLSNFVAPTDIKLDASGNILVAASFVLRISQNDWWNDLGGSAPGINGRPALRSKGDLSPGTSMDRVLTNVPASTPMLAWISFSSTPLDAIGGTVHAFPPNAQLLFNSDVSGQSSLSVNWPAGIASDIEIFLQFVVQDFSVPDGLTLSNALLMTTP